MDSGRDLNGAAGAGLSPSSRALGAGNGGERGRGEGGRESRGGDSGAANSAAAVVARAEQNLKMRGEIVNLEETKVRAIRKTVAMRLRLAAFETTLTHAVVTQKMKPGR